MGYMGNAKSLDRKPTRDKSTLESKYTWGNKTEMDLGRVECEDLDWIQMALLNVVMNYRDL